MRAKNFHLLSIALLALLAVGCSRTTDNTVYDKASDYMPLQPGKYFIYRLDSTVFTNFNQSTEVHSYQEKQVIDSMITDNLGRPSYRVFRYLRDVAGANPWLPAGSFFITPQSQSIEVIQNNLRYIKLANPVATGQSWNPYRFLPYKPFNASYGPFDNDNDMTTPDWNYTYTALNQSLTAGGNTFNNVLVVTGVNESTEPDTVAVQSNAAAIVTRAQTIYITGAPTDTVKATTNYTPSEGFTLAIYNATNRLVKLGSITTPPSRLRNYQWTNGQWNFANGKDTLIAGIAISSKNFALDKYAKGIGLVSSEFIMRDFQAYGTPGRHGFGVKRTLISYN